jgi:hypothetical protein
MDKAHILREIKRTADANDGIPLGVERFTNETGIKRYEWMGVYWARWGDALREAGYMPNQLQQAYEPEELLEQYARFAVELGRLPTNADMRLKTRSDPDFPASTTFSNRWSKAELVAQLLEYCRGKDGYEEVVRLCEGYTPRTQSEEQTQTAPGDVTMGYVYLVKMGRHYKIGMTNSVGRREYELNLQLPERTELIHVIATDDPLGIEEYWHKRFVAKNTNGEWFALDSVDVAAFKRRKFM